MDEGNKRSNFLPISILIAAALVSGSIVYSTINHNNNGSPGDQGNIQKNLKNGKSANNAAKNISEISDNDVVLGNKDAKVSIIEYSDYQCPFCGRFFSKTESKIIDDYVKTGKAKFAYRNLPFLGEESVLAAEAAECAKDQGKFWLYHDALFNAEIKDGKENNGNLGRKLFISLAKQTDMNVDVFSKCIDSGKYKDKIVNDLDFARNAGVNSTPTFLINGKKILGAQPYSVFKSVIDGFVNSKN